MNTDAKQDFRTALGTFATGVTVITTVSETGEPVGVTASSFNSVSLDPPLVLWSLAKNSLSTDAFCSSGHFAIHVLTSDQQDLSNKFAKSGGDKFSGVDWEAGSIKSPVLDEYAALFECKTMHQYEGGDHLIFVGEVINFDLRERDSLVFHGGQYAEARPKVADNGEPGVDLSQGRFTDDFLLYLISRAHFQSSRPTRSRLAELGVSQSEYMTLAVLSMNAPASAQDIAERLDHTGFAPDVSALNTMVGGGLLVAEGDAFDLSETGRKHLVSTLAVAKAFEDDLLDHFTFTEIADAKRVLKKLIDLTDEDVPQLWNVKES